MERTYIIGLEIGNKESQLCVWDEKQKDAVSQTVTAFGSRVRFPTRLSYMPSTDKWSFGTEADFFAQNHAAALDDKVLENCESGRETVLDGRAFPPEVIFAHFVALSLTVAGVKRPAQEIRVLTVTVPRITKELAMAARKAFAIIGFDPGQAYLQDNQESFFCHTFYQKSDVYRQNVGLFVFTGPNEVEFRSLSLNRSTKPQTVTIEEDSGCVLTETYSVRDRQFCEYIRKMLGDKDYSGIFIVGDAFDRSWARESLTLVCKGQRKVFTGDNLFAKGACYASLEKCSEKRLRGMLYLGSDLVKENIGMDMCVNGQQAYYPLISAGRHWYEQENEVEFLLDDEAQIVFRLSKLDGGERSKVVMELPGLPKRPPKTTRIHLTIRYEAADRCVIEAADLGFGELFRSSGIKWKEIL